MSLHQVFSIASAVLLAVVCLLIVADEIDPERWFTVSMTAVAAAYTAAGAFK